jgi:hypothetical protein
LDKYVSKSFANSIRKDLDLFEESLERYSKPAQDYWRTLVRERYEWAIKSNEDPELQKAGRSLKEEHFLRIAEGAKVLASDGPPTGIKSKDGTFMTVSPFIRPTLSRKGNMGWEDPVVGITFSKKKEGQMVLEQNRVLLPYDLVQGRAKALHEYHLRWTRLVQSKEFGGAEAAKLREPSEAEITSFLESLTSRQRKSMRTSGIDLGGESRVRRNNSPGSGGARAQFTKVLSSEQYLAQRERDIVKAYLRQTPSPGKPAVSPWTGLPVSPPGVITPGGYPSTVDHVRPLSDLYERLPKNRRATDAEILSLLRERDVASNFVVAERGINAVKGERTDWIEVLQSIQKSQKNYEKRVLESNRNPVFTPGTTSPLVPTVIQVIKQTQSVPESPRSGKLTPERRAEALLFIQELQGKL